MIDGILVIDKPVGMTSFGVVSMVRRRLGIKKAGHAGTLDPMATGVLPVCLGKATKLAQFIMGGQKVYEGVIRLGVSTDTYDSEGVVMGTRPLGPGLDIGAIREAADGFTGKILQAPPPFSAVKHNGQPLYKLARKGILIEKAPRQVEVFSFDLLKVDIPDISFRIHCSKGTYIRSIAHGLGEALGCGGCLAALRRTVNGQFGLGHAIGIDALDGILAADRLLDVLIPIDMVRAVGVAGAANPRASAGPDHIGPRERPASSLETEDLCGAQTPNLI
ncbi:MAG: tRNA pseudouridine(55) synthase TruB [Desulfobacteraceae bacterium]|nr:tRNA pseudouridine(55) synthase TruB [Desulfobacteraceae bacterium]